MEKACPVYPLYKLKNPQGEKVPQWMRRLSKPKSVSLILFTSSHPKLISSAFPPPHPPHCLLIGPSSLRQKHPVLTIFPFSCGWIDDAKELIIGDRFGVEVSPDRAAFHDLVGLVQGPQHLRLASSCTAHHEHGVPHRQELLQLDHLGDTESGQRDHLSLTHIPTAPL